MKEYFVWQNSSCPLSVTPALLLDDSAGRFAREFWWTNQQFFLADIPPWFSILTYNLGDEQ
jgi:hypothetical protein